MRLSVPLLSIVVVVCSFVLLLAPSLTKAQMEVTEEYEGYLNSLADEIEEMVLYMDADYLLEAMSPELAERIGADVREALSPEQEIIDFNLYGRAFSKIDEMHYRIDAKYLIEGRGIGGTWSTQGLSTYVVLEDGPEYMTITDTDLQEALFMPSVENILEDFGVLLYLFVAIGLAGTGFWIWMIVDLMKREIPDKILWIILVIFAGFIGALIYFFTGRNKYPIKPTSL